MSNATRIKFLVSNIYSGIGIGLLLGFIMGNSVSGTVQTVIVVITGMLGALLGLENKIGKTEINESNNTAVNIKLGSFGFGVVLGILFGITVRTHNLFAPTITERMKNWTEAGFDSISARKYVLYEKFQINPKTGDITLESDQHQKGNSSILFKAEDLSNIGTELDTTYFEGEIQNAIDRLEIFENNALNDLLTTASKTLPEENQMIFLAIIQKMIFQSEDGISYCDLPQSIDNSDSEVVRNLYEVLSETNNQPRKNLIDKIRTFLCNSNN
ncbi:hypothetical protein P700755_004021 [Psychroflexus torquis ATCC 700755]|uniref:Uncharacterized protein n=1 Tax=Psychroflexus torquis (strain ATCC 700755 / CIP 106069 / ACAM 623) TaxID=313595 RepID=K4IJ55_PSYTT|nr:hypothetical protein [Psychroflexus torquis]AFU70577.1 hypothetical protein P700755_004021 [Psychroflexus torquis ATCC 700755]